MKLLVLSDEHGEDTLLRRILQKESDADAVIFLGDGVRDVERWQEENPAKRVYLVRGNCDFGSAYPVEAVAAFGGVVFLYTHGHEYSVKTTLNLLVDAARRSEAQIVLFGHTHFALHAALEGIELFNPGSLARSPTGEAPSYGIIQVARGVAECTLCHWEE